jgi:hypothetical protein
MPEQLDLFDAGNGGDQSAQLTSVRQFAVTRRKLASEPGVSEFASSPTPYIWRGGNGEHTPASPAGIKPTQFADSQHHAEAVDLVIANLGGRVLGQATAEQNTAYRIGLCIDCRTVRHSAARPRCNGCHAALTHRVRPAAPGRTGPHSARAKGRST